MEALAFYEQHYHNAQPPGAHRGMGYPPMGYQPGYPPPAANPPGASFPHSPLQYNIIYVQRGAAPAAAEIEAVLSLRVDYNENWRVRAAAAIACETQKTKRCLILFG